MWAHVASLWAHIAASLLAHVATTLWAHVATTLWAHVATTLWAHVATSVVPAATFVAPKVCVHPGVEADRGVALLLLLLPRIRIARILTAKLLPSVALLEVASSGVLVEVGRSFRRHVVSTCPCPDEVGVDARPEAPRGWGTEVTR